MKQAPLTKAIERLQGKRTDAEFARALGVHRNYPARWKAGVKPSTEHLQALVADGLDRAYLLGPSLPAQGKGAA